MREKRMHDLLFGNVINYSLVRLPERKAYIWGQINLFNFRQCHKPRQDCRGGFHLKWIPGEKSSLTQVFGDLSFISGQPGFVVSHLSNFVCQRNKVTGVL